MKSAQYIAGFFLAFVAVLAIQAFVVMTATAFLATELGVGAALSYADSVIGALIIDVFKIMFRVRQKAAK